MGCSQSKLDDEEAVQLCKDRKKFIKQAVEQRTKFASGHLAYIQSLKRVSAALKDYIEGDEPREFLLDSFVTPPPVKKASPKGFISISPNTTLRVNYLRPSGTPGVLVEERPPQSPETFRVQAYSPVHQYGFDGFFPMQSSPMHSSSFFSYSPNHINRANNIPPPSPQTSQWDFFWNPFSSLDYYGYPTRSSIEQMAMDDEIRGLRQVREEEGIPDLEDETEPEETLARAKVDKTCNREEVIVEDVDDNDEDEDDDDDDDDEGDDSEEHDDDEDDEEEGATKGQNLQPQGRRSIEILRAQCGGQVGVSGNKQMEVGNEEVKEETPGFTVYVNRRPTSMAEVIKDLEAQFKVVCTAANEVSALLESSRAHYSSTSNEHTAMKMLNPVALLRSASSRSSSSRFLMNSSCLKDEGYQSTSEFHEESSCMFSGSHQSTLDRLYAWEKKLYEEVRAGEKVRIAYDKKCKQLKNQDVRGDDPSAVDKTRAAIRDLHTHIKVSIHSVEAISKRIETLRDDELQPQLIELIQGLARMWKIMAESHQSQKRTLDEAKLLLAGTPSKFNRKNRHSSYISLTEPSRLARSAANLEAELRNWRACFESWITSQRSYVHALTGWLLRCVRCDPDMSKLPSSPRRSSVSLPIFGLCIKWSKYLDSIRETPVLDGLDFFAAGMGSMYAQQIREDSSNRVPLGGSNSKRCGIGLADECGNRNMEVVEVGQLEEEEFSMSLEKMAEVAIKVLCAGMSVAMSSLTEFSIGSAEKYGELVNQWENTKGKT